VTFKGRLALVALVVIGAAVLLVSGGGSGGGGDQYRVDAIFDVARGIGPQQVVKIAGAQVGTVTGVRLTSDYKARVEMTIDTRFAPFRANASCQIEPEGVISENFVECSPGTPSAPPLRADSSGAPTVPVTQTTEPISLQDLFNIWSTPVSERLSVLLDELGIGVSGRAGDIQAILDRANPALAAARQAIALVNRQRSQLQELVSAAAPVVGQLADHDTAVQRFLSQSATLTAVTSAHSGALSATIARLPALLRSAQPALEQLDAVGSAATPLLVDLRRAVPSISLLTQTIPPFSAQAVTALQALAPALDAGRSALADATPTLERLRQFAIDADPAGESLDQLLVSLRDSGAFESLLRGLYNGAALTSHYDANSHVIFADLLANACLTYATTPSVGCDAHLNGSAKILGEPDALRHRHRRRAIKPSTPTTLSSLTTLVNTLTRVLRATHPKPAPSATVGSLQTLLQFLLR